MFSQTSQGASLFGNPSSSSSKNNLFAFTPLSYWISKLLASGLRSELEPKILEVLIANGAESSLRQCNVAGFPLHQVIKASFPSLARVLINEDPELVFLEDTTGTTPYELSVRCLLNRVRHHHIDFDEAAPSLLRAEAIVDNLRMDSTMPDIESTNTDGPPSISNIEGAQENRMRNPRPLLLMPR